MIVRRSPERCTRFVLRRDAAKTCRGRAAVVIDAGRRPGNARLQEPSTGDWTGAWPGATGQPPHVGFIAPPRPCRDQQTEIHRGKQHIVAQIHEDATRRPRRGGNNCTGVARLMAEHPADTAGSLPRNRSRSAASCDVCLENLASMGRSDKPGSRTVEVGDDVPRE